MTPHAKPQPAAPALAPDANDHKAKLAGYINAKCNVAAYVHALQNIDLSGINFKTLPKDLQKKLPEDPAVLLGQVQKNLGIAKSHGLDWSNNIQPDLTKIPLAIIDYGTLFIEAIKEIRPLVNDPDIDNDPAKRKMLVDLFNALLQSINDQQTSVANEIDKLKLFNKNVTDDHGNFSSANKQFQIIDQFEEENIKELQAAIAGLDSVISTLNKKITVEAVAVGASVALMAGGALGLAFAATGVGAVVGGLSLAIGMIGLGVSLGFLISDIEKKQRAQQEESFDKLEVTELSIQVQALHSTEDSVGKLVTMSAQAVSSVQVILDTWATLNAKIQSVLTDLNDAEKHVKDVVSLLDLDTATDLWQQLATFAGQMQEFESKSFGQAPATLKLKPMVVKRAA
jgi:hypothetical protein